MFLKMKQVLKLNFSTKCARTHLSGDIVGIITNTAVEEKSFYFAVPYNILNRVVPILLVEGE